MVFDEIGTVNIDMYYPEAYQEPQIALGEIVVNELNSNDIYTNSDMAGIRKLLRNLFGVCIEYGWGCDEWRIVNVDDAYDEYDRQGFAK